MVMMSGGRLRARAVPIVALPVTCAMLMLQIAIIIVVGVVIVGGEGKMEAMFVSDARPVLRPIQHAGGRGAGEHHRKRGAEHRDDNS